MRMEDVVKEELIKKIKQMSLIELDELIDEISYKFKHTLTCDKCNELYGGCENNEGEITVSCNTRMRSYGDIELPTNIDMVKYLIYDKNNEKYIKVTENEEALEEYKGNENIIIQKFYFDNTEKDWAFEVLQS